MCASAMSQYHVPEVPREMCPNVHFMDMHTYSFMSWRRTDHDNTIFLLTIWVPFDRDFSLRISSLAESDSNLNHFILGLIW